MYAFMVVYNIDHKFLCQSKLHHQQLGLEKSTTRVGEAINKATFISSTGEDRYSNNLG